MFKSFVISNPKRFISRIELGDAFAIAIQVLKYASTIVMLRKYLADTAVHDKLNKLIAPYFRKKIVLKASGNTYSNHTGTNHANNTYQLNKLIFIHTPS